MCKKVDVSVLILALDKVHIFPCIFRVIALVDYQIILLFYLLDAQVYWWRKVSCLTYFILRLLFLEIQKSLLEVILIFAVPRTYRDIRGGMMKNFYRRKSRSLFSTDAYFTNITLSGRTNGTLGFIIVRKFFRDHLSVKRIKGGFC